MQSTTEYFSHLDITELLKDIFYMNNKTNQRHPNPITVTSLCPFTAHVLMIITPDII